MARRRTLLFAASLVLCGFAAPAGAPSPIKEHPMDQASRGAPPKVPPVVIDGVRYSQVLNARRIGIDAGSGWMMASDEKSGERLWTLRVYEVVIHPDDETDVQETYFTSMSRIAGRRALLIRNESHQAFEVDVDTRQVTPAK